jgi:hypothetical protein
MFEGREQAAHYHIVCVFVEVWSLTRHLGWVQAEEVNFQLLKFLSGRVTKL